MLAAQPASTGSSTRTPDPARWAASGVRPWALLLIFLGFYLLTASGHLYAVDEETLYRITESVVERHTLALPNDAWGLVLSEQPPNGRQYAQYEPGQAFAAVPFYLLGRAVAPLFPPDARAYVLRFFVGMLGALVTAATVVLLYRLVGALGYSEGIALSLAAIYGTATFAWPFARTFFAEPLTALCLLASFYATRLGSRAEGRGQRAEGDNPQARRLANLRPLFCPLPPALCLLLGGVAAALSLLVKPHAAIAL